LVAPIEKKQIRTLEPLKQIEVFIPGKVMLAGEDAVLRGGHALAATLDCGMNINVEWQNHSADWEIHSNLWSEPKFVHDDHTPQIDMLCRAVQFAAKRCGMHGGKVTVSSDIEIKHGIGSSSALRLGICAAFFALKNGPDENRSGGIPIEAVNAAWQLQSEGQGVASGYDIATQFAGGLLEFSFEYHDNKWKPHWFKHDLNNLADIIHVFVGGKGAPTAQTTQTTSSWLESANRNEKLMENSEALVDVFNLAIQWPETRNINRLVQACGAVRQLFVGSPHFPTEVADHIQTTPGCDRSWSWKTTGAGGEDALLIIGKSSEIAAVASKLWDIGWHRLNVPFNSGGARIVSFSTAEKPGLKARVISPSLNAEVNRD
jgi:mevalonate kinase